MEDETARGRRNAPPGRSRRARSVRAARPPRSDAPILSSSPAAATRARIARAALEAFAFAGIEGATTREIARRAGLSEGALYRHFPSKEAIAESLFAGAQERLARALRETRATGVALDEQAAAIVAAVCRTAEADWTLFSFHLQSAPHFLPAPPGADDPAAAAQDVVAAAMAQGEIPAGDPALVAAMALGPVLEAARAILHGRLEGPLLAHAPRLAVAVRAVLSSWGSS